MMSNVHPYMPNSAPENKNAMLRSLGLNEIEDLYKDIIPKELRFRGKMKLPDPIVSEQALSRHVTGILNRNQSCEEMISFLGGGCYNHYVPAICDEINSRAEFLTAYCGDTYSDHGKMQAIFEYASLMAELLDMDVVSYTLYDGGQAVCSSIRMAVRIQASSGHEERQTVLIPATMNPDIRSQLINYCKGHVCIETMPFTPDGRVEADWLRHRLNSGNIAAVFIENPSYLGFWQTQLEEISRCIHEAGAIFIVQPEVASLGIIKPPAQYGADIVCGEIQPLGMHMQFGSGCAGFIASHYDKDYISQYPTYLYGIAGTGRDGQYGWGRALNYRCSHGSRENANEYFGTESGLWCITAAVYLSLMGPEGMRELGTIIAQMRHYAVQRLSTLPSIHVNVLGGDGFQEFVIDFSPCGKTVSEINRKLLDCGIAGGKDLSRDFPMLRQAALYCVTEKTTCEQIDCLYEALSKILSET